MVLCGKLTDRCFCCFWAARRLHTSHVSFNVAKKCVRISCIRVEKLLWPASWRESLFFFLFTDYWTTLERFWVWFIFILSGVTLKTSNTVIRWRTMCRRCSVYKIMGLAGLHDSYGSWHNFAHLPFSFRSLDLYVASLLFVKRTSHCVIRRK